MSVFRVEKNKNYTVMSNYHLRDKRLSLKAKGLLSYMLSLPEDWDYSIKGLCKINKENESAIRTALKELETSYNLERHRVRNDKGLFEYDYIVYENPKTEPYIDFPYTDNPHTENQTQINTNKLNINNKDKLDKTLSGITKELIKRKFIDENDLVLYSYDSFFNELLTKYSYKECIIVVSYVLSKLKNRNDIENKFCYFKTSVLNNLEKLENKNLPSWFNDNIEIKEPTEEQKQELEELLSTFDEELSL